MESCIFCMIVDGSIPARKVYEDENVLAFDDIAPQAPVHTLVIPKKHYANMGDSVGLVDIGVLFDSVHKVAQIKGVDRDGYRVIVNNGPDANQTVGHLHIHILGGRRMAHGMVDFGGE